MLPLHFRSKPIKNSSRSKFSEIIEISEFWNETHLVPCFVVFICNVFDHNLCKTLGERDKEGR